MFKNKPKAKKLYLFNLYFGRIIKVIEKYLEARQSLVYMTFYGIGKEQLKSYKNCPAKYVIWACFYQIVKY